jgi:hypothetical protein
MLSRRDVGRAGGESAFSALEMKIAMRTLPYTRPILLVGAGDGFGGVDPANASTPGSASTFIAGLPVLWIAGVIFK